MFFRNNHILLLLRCYAFFQTFLRKETRWKIPFFCSYSFPTFREKKRLRGEFATQHWLKALGSGSYENVSAYSFLSLLPKSFRPSKILFPFSFLLFPFILFSQNYLWPTNASNYMTSSFGEYRSGHFHTAIDIKTWNQEGYPCYAIEDGQVERVRVSPFGYGKVIYLRLKDGRTAVYAHLQKFSKEIEQAVFQLQLQNRRYSVDWHPTDWKCKKGQIIAYTGETGAGSPHLHFELRDEQNRPLNPLKFFPQIKDRLAPTLQALLIIPQDENSAVNGSFLPQKVALRKLSGNHYQPEQPVKVRGKIGMALMGFDLADGVFNKFAFYQTLLSVQGQTIFRRVFDRLDYETNGQVDIDIDYPRRMESGEVFSKLFIEPFNELAIYQRELGDGFITITEDEIPFTIKATDFFGNGSLIEGFLIPERRPAVEFQMVKKINEFAFVRMKLPNTLKSLRFAASVNHREWQEIDYYEILERSFAENSQNMLIKVMLPSAQMRFLQAILTVTSGETVRANLSLDSVSAANPRFKIHNRGKFLVLEFSGLEGLTHLRLDIAQNNHVTSFRPRLLEGRCEHVLPARIINDDSLRIQLFTGQQALFDSLLFFNMLLPSKEQTHIFKDGVCELIGAKGCVYDTLLVDFQSISSAASKSGQPLAGPVFVFSYNQQIFKEPFTLRVRYDSLAFPLSKIGIYQWNGNGRLSLVGADHDSLRRIFSGQIPSLGKFVLAADTVAPQVQIIAPDQNQTFTKLLLIKCTIRDELSGIPSDKNIEIEVDGQFVVPEWDPEKETVVGRLHWQLSPGQHRLVIKVNDQAGNEMIRSRVINIVRGKP